MSELMLPHGGKLTSRLLKGEELAEERKRAAELPTVRMPCLTTMTVFIYTKPTKKILHQA